MFQHCSYCSHLDEKNKSYDGYQCYCFYHGYVYPDSLVCDDYFPAIFRSYSESMKIEEDTKMPSFFDMIFGRNSKEDDDFLKRAKKRNEEDLERFINSNALFDYRMRESEINKSKYVHNILKNAGIGEYYPMYKQLSKFRNYIVPSNSSYSYIERFDSIIGDKLNRKVVADSSNRKFFVALMNYIDKVIYEKVINRDYDGAYFEWKILFDTLAEHYGIDLSVMNNKTLNKKRR